MAYVENVNGADLALILAAPELLEALESIVADCLHYAKLAGDAWQSAAIGRASSAERAQAVVRKARGG